jgi:hypothetical protein
MLGSFFTTALPLTKCIIHGAEKDDIDLYIKTLWAIIMERLVFIFLGILTINSSCSKTSCEKANRSAINDFNAGQYSLHSQEVLPVENAYFYVLRQYYNVSWYFTDSLDYYGCYDSTMVTLLNQKYQFDILAKARQEADSLESAPNWSKPAEYLGGIGEFLRYVRKKLNTNGLKTKTLAGQNSSFNLRLTQLDKCVTQKL